VSLWFNGSAHVDLSFLPVVDATLNGLATVLLISGFVLIKQRRIAAHRACMIAAFSASCLFLVFYLIHYAWRAYVTGTAETHYHGPLRHFYYVMLASHILLAATVPVFAIWMIRLGLARRDQTHRRVARYAYPIWLYVSITGVLIYFMLYHLNAPAT
jgi:uncharacterized membrane protein YozB (DUF420 family)